MLLTSFAHSVCAVTAATMLVSLFLVVAVAAVDFIKMTTHTHRYKIKRNSVQDPRYTAWYYRQRLLVLIHSRETHVHIAQNLRWSPCIGL